MDINLLNAIDALGGHIRLLKECIEDMKTEIEYLRNELKEHQRIIVDLEKKLAEKDEDIARLLTELAKSREAANG